MMQPQIYRKFLNFRLPTNFTVNTLNFKLKGSTMLGYLQMMQMAEDPDQTAPIGAVSAPPIGAV